MAQVAKAHSGLEFVQLGIPPYRFAMIGVTDAEIGQVLQRLAEPFIGKTDGAALNGGKHLGSVETQDGGIAITDQRNPLVPHAKSMGCVI